MAVYRSGRIEEKRQKQRLLMATLGSIAVLAFFGVFGLKILVGFSLLVDRIRGTTPSQQIAQTLLLPPVLDPLPSATKSATLVVTGIATQGVDVIIYVNEDQEDRFTVEENGTFTTTLTGLSEGTNTISARATDESETISDPSNVLTIVIKKTAPIIELTAPADHITVNGEPNRVTVEGKTEENTSVTVNGRIVVIRSDNTFSYQHPLNEGENKLTIVATDDAGNTSTAERTVTYQR